MLRGPDPERRVPKGYAETFHIWLAVLAGQFMCGAVAAARAGVQCWWVVTLALLGVLLLRFSLYANRRALKATDPMEPAAAGV